LKALLYAVRPMTSIRLAMGITSFLRVV
jgi:hypothetical protein